MEDNSDKPDWSLGWSLGWSPGWSPGLFLETYLEMEPHYNKKIYIVLQLVQIMNFTNCMLQYLLQQYSLYNHQYSISYTSVHSPEA